ncbi:MAG TPA: hypothetical protein VHX14_21385 [Thermoanaerobaculia bacterium]|nr:hypothetical protein [Thermoanaerobaculia bacterium]
MKKLKAQIEKAGGQIMISGDIPDELAEMLTRTIADCPDCAAAMLASSRQQHRARHEH